MKTKLAQLRELWAQGSHVDALHMAARFPRLGEHKVAIERGWEAAARPELYRQMGQDPDQLVEAGLDALEERYSLETRRQTCG